MLTKRVAFGDEGSDEKGNAERMDGEEMLEMFRKYAAKHVWPE